jgi:hypothetical protein
VYGSALALEGWGHGLEWLMDRASRDGAWQEVVRLAAALEARPDGDWRAGRVAALGEALERLGDPAAAAQVRARPDPVPGRPLRVRFGKDLELAGVDVPATARPGDTVRLGYHWRLLGPTAYDYWVFLHAVGLPGGGIHDALVGPEQFGTSHWRTGERVRQMIAFPIPRDAAPGTYALRAGVWLPSTGRRLYILSSDVPQTRRAVTLGTLVVR